MPSSSSPPPPPPTPQTITTPQFTSILSLYPSTVEKAYRRNPRLKEAKKLSNALEDDRWRYEELPGVVAQRKRRRRRGGGEDGGGGGWLEKEEVERLVGWKITHGTHRPFLPSLVHQNSPETIKSTTSTAFSNLDPPPKSPHYSHPYPQLKSALSTLIKPLKGIGPATATLLLSIHSPDSIPFFSDELYAWLVHQNMDKDKDKQTKLKYDLKEYERLYDAFVAFRERLMLEEEEEEEVKAVDVEKVAFVLGHWALLLSEEERRGIVILGQGGEVQVRKQERVQQQDEIVVVEGGKEDAGEKGGGENPGLGPGRNEGGAEDIGNTLKGEGLPQRMVAEKKGGSRETARLPKNGRKVVKEERQPVDNDASVRRSKRLKRS